MGLIVFEITRKGQRTTKNVSRELLWYEWAPRDADGNLLKDENGNEIQGKMHKFQGGKLDFKYDFREKKMNATVAPLKITSYETESNEKRIKEWVEANRLPLELSEASGAHIILFPDKNKEKINKALQETDFNYELV